MNNKTKLLVLKFISSSLIMSTSILISGCISDEYDIQPDEREEVFVQEDISLDSNELVDEQGRKYSLIENSDGTETALFEDGQSITFRRDINSGELELISPKDDSDMLSAGLGFLAGMTTSYFIYKGLTPPTGQIVGARYIPDSRPSIMSLADRQSYYDRYMRSIKEKERSHSAGYAPSSSHSSDISGKGSVNLSKQPNPKTSVNPPTPSAKSGFGSVGARGSAVS